MKAWPRICVVSDSLGPPLDEGIRKFTASIIRGLSHHSLVVQGLAVGTDVNIGSNGDVLSIRTNKLFLSPPLRRQMLALDPDVICYVPTASCTFFSFLRARLLKAFQPRARVVMVVLQARKHGALARHAIRWLRPDAVFAQSHATMDLLASLGCQPIFLPSGVDLGRFRPVLAAEKARLRAKYSLPLDDFLVLHVGHLKGGRNVEAMAGLRPHALGVMLAARSMGQERGLRQELEDKGIVIIDTYMEEVQEIYQACDCYMFPVRDAGLAIDIPLSVLEAMACNLPVIAYPFGGLPLLFEPGDGLWFATRDEDFLQAIGDAKVSPLCRTRQMVEPYSWEGVAVRLLDVLEGVDDVKGHAGNLAR